VAYIISRSETQVAVSGCFPAKYALRQAETAADFAAIVFPVQQAAKFSIPAAAEVDIGALHLFGCRIQKAAEEKSDYAS